MIKILLIILMLIISSHVNSEYIDNRYCGQPERTDDGRIKRSMSLIKTFKDMYPLPDGYDSTKWNVDHVIPLANGGCDSIINLQWLHVDIKRCADDVCKDRWEREVYPVRH